MVGVSEATLRFWEKEFPTLKPRTPPGGTRAYSKEDIEQVKLIFHLVKEKGLTLEGARKRMRENKEGVVDNHAIVERLKGIRAELVTMMKAMDENPHKKY